MPKRPGVIRSSTYILPNLLTAFNLICGIIAILLVLENFAAKNTVQPQEYIISAWLLLAAMIFDFLDGKVARWTNTVSDFGMKVDSFTDFVSFGIAPVLLAYAALLQSLPVVLQILPCFFFLTAGAWRLARFNCETSNQAPANFFNGLPIPAASALISTIILISGGPQHVVPAFLGQSLNSLPPVTAGTLVAFVMSALAVLMVSHVPFPAFKRVNRRNLILLAGVAIFLYVLSLLLPWGNIFFLIMLLYIFIGLFQYFSNRVLKMHEQRRTQRV
ncbi:CDP-diacylglycerol--serine O-phosphatidyltransferase [candidate division FCPU426 bacterium]|nr:CDP-diacylglycerol--serine O-phosphatidyltransferase [candidate division FCPU426 bacterium]